MKSTLAVMATGTGKTVVMAELVKRWQSGRVMMIAHREELVFQAADKFSRHCGEDVGVEMADAFVREWNADRPRIVVASVQTLNSGNQAARYEKFDPREFGLILTDEAHHATASSYRRIYEWFGRNPECRHLGVTATPDRADEEALGSVYESVAFEYGILDAISEGWLVPIQQEFVQVDGLDLSGCKSDKHDLKDGSVAEVMEQEENLYAVADSTRRIASGRKTLIFTASVPHAHRIADILCGYEEDSAVAIDGKTDREERRYHLRRFARGDIRYLCNCGVLTEGFDDPTVEVVSMARPTKSRALYAQVIGRGTRPLPGIVDTLIDPVARQSAIAGSLKPFCTVLDFVGNSGRHKLISTADILGGNEPDEIVERATRNAKGRGKSVDMREELEAARKEIEEEKHRERITPQARFHRATIDPFDIMDIVPRREPGWFKGKRPTPKMENCLRKFGVDDKWLKNASLGQAKQLIGKLIDRSERKLSSLRQVKCLRKFGIDATNMPFQEAGRTIDRIAKNGWKL